MATRDSAIAKARLLPRDFGEPFSYEGAGDGKRKIFELALGNIDTDGLSVRTRTAGVETALTLSATDTPAAGQFYLWARPGFVSVGTAPPLNTDLLVDGVGNLATIDTDVGSFIDIAFDLHARGRSPALTWAAVTPAEEYAIALLAVIEALWAQIAEAGQEVDITTPEGMHIPAGQRFNQLLALLESLRAHYMELAQALNVGPYRIAVSTLRRVSRTTNRLVPVYVPREFDDQTPPVRVYPPIDTGTF